MTLLQALERVRVGDRAATGFEELLVQAQLTEKERTVALSSHEIAAIEQQSKGDSSARDSDLRLVLWLGVRALSR